MGWGLLPPPKHGVPRAGGGGGAWRGAGWPGGERGPRGRAAPRRGRLRSAAPWAGTAAPSSAAGRGAGGEAPCGAAEAGRSAQTRPLRPGPGRRRKGRLRGAEGGSFGGRRVPRRPATSRANGALTGARHDLLPPGSISAAGPRLRRGGTSAPCSGSRRGQRWQPAGPAGAERTEGALGVSLPSSAPRLRAASSHCVQRTGRGVPSRLISPPLSLLPLPSSPLFPTYLLFTPLFLAFPWNSCRLFPDTSIPTEGSSWRQFCTPCSLGDAPHQTRARLAREVPQPPLPFQSIPETSSGAPRVTSSM